VGATAGLSSSGTPQVNRSLLSEVPVIPTSFWRGETFLFDN
jgi:hypothetical protein